MLLTVTFSVLVIPSRPSPKVRDSGVISIFGWHPFPLSLTASSGVLGSFEMTLSAPLSSPWLPGLKVSVTSALCSTFRRVGLICTDLAAAVVIPMLAILRQMSPLFSIVSFLTMASPPTVASPKSTCGDSMWICAARTVTRTVALAVNFPSVYSTCTSVVPGCTAATTTCL